MRRPPRNATTKPAVKRHPSPPEVKEMAPKPRPGSAEPAEAPRQGTDMTDEQIDKMLKAAYT